MQVIGLTGKICSGKNAVADYLSDKGFMVVDVDRLGHVILNREAEKAAGLFGRDILLPDGDGVDRAALAAKVFRKDDAGAGLARLEQFLHPLMVRECRNIIEQAGDTVSGVVLNAAILKRMGLDTLCNQVFYIRAGFIIRYCRARKYRGMRLEDFRQRNRNQADITADGFHCDTFSILNVGSILDLQGKIDRILEQTGARS